MTSKIQAAADLAALLAAYKGPVTKVATGAAALPDARPSDWAKLAKATRDERPAILEAAATREAKPAKRVKRDCAAQRRYDAAHGTVNGYDPKILEWQALHDREMES